MIFIFSLYLQRYRGEIPSHRCISLLFRTYRKDLGNHFGIVRFKKQRDSLRRQSSHDLYVAMHTLRRGAFL